MSEVGNNPNDTQAGDKADNLIGGDYGVYTRPGVYGDGKEYRIKSRLGKEFLYDTFGIDDKGQPIPGSTASFEDIQNRITSYLRTETEGFTEEELQDLQHFKVMAGLDESGHGGDERAGDTIHDHVYSKYLRKNVSGNSLDSYDVPQYVFTLYMLKANKYSEFIKKGYGNSDTESSESSRKDSESNAHIETNRTLKKPAPEDYVIISQTATTDIGIDDVEIQTLNGVNNDITPTLITFRLTEPGSVTLLDRLTEAKNFCGYQTESTMLPGMFLELKFQGYTDSEGNRDDGGAIITAPFNSVNEGSSGATPQTEVYFELGGITYDMQITPEGAVYNFSAYRQKSGGIEDLRLDTTHTIKGKNLTELFGGDREDETIDGEENPAYGLQYAFKKDFESLDEKANTDDQGPSNNLRRKFILDVSNFIENTKKSSDGEGDDESNPADKVNVTKDTISNALLTDYELLETFAKSGNITKGEDKNGKDYDWVEKEEMIMVGHGVSEDEVVSRELKDKGISVGGATAGVTITQDVKSRDGGIVYTDPVISIEIPAGTHLKDCIYLILALSQDFVDKSLKYDIKDVQKKELKLDKAYSRWVTLDTDHYYDYDDWDEDTKTYGEHIVVRPTLSFNSNPNMIMSKEEVKPQEGLKELKTRLDSLDIKKEYYYSFTGKNDQVIDINFNFDEAFALTIPAVGFGDFSMQSAMATATFLKEDEAGANTQSNTGIADDLEQNKRATGILDSLKELSDADLSNFADYMGFSDEEQKRLINEKNANGTGIRGSEGWRYEDQELLKSLSAGLSVDGVGDALLSGYTSENPPANETAPTESEQVLIDLSEDYGVKSPYIYASSLVMGLEGEDGVSHWMDLDNTKAKDFVRSIKPGIKTVETPDHVKETPDERGSIRKTAMSHLMRASTNAASHQKLDMNIRGDTDWLGNDCYYGIPKDQDGRLDFIAKTHDVMFVMESPRKLDFDETEEDNNTGLFDFGNLNYTMSGVYFVASCSSNFSQGLFTQTLSMIYQYKYDMSKIETLRKDEQQYADYYNEDRTIKEQSEYSQAVTDMIEYKRGTPGTPTTSDMIDQGNFSASDGTQSGRG